MTPPEPSLFPAISGRPAVRLMGIPSDQHSSFLRGSASAPPAIRAALYTEASGMWTESGLNLGDSSLFKDAGDLALEGSQNLVDQIASAAEAAFRTGDRPLFLGGDHFITYPLVRGMARVLAHVTLIQFDAHPDLYDEYESDRLSHACPFARIMEEGLVDKLIQVGIRGANGHLRDQARRFGVEVLEMRALPAKWPAGLAGPIYVSFDLDVLDPAFVPGVSHPEPGGLSTREALRFLDCLPGPVIGADLVELNPLRDVGGLTAVTAAKLVKELAGAMLKPA